MPHPQNAVFNLKHSGPNVGTANFSMDNIASEGNGTMRVNALEALPDRQTTKRIHFFHFRLFY